ncbi:protein mono-ADP-ribosyltransferase PARP15-like [Gigantopelta aegis]|uniref:protein mono-ADP-ribosyltransferase PARP15-like n=1 Tax=Gigantopelta aegis TaxID=1735272 RepID=UPI001B88A1CF|nr:protein mono-ADP-ribosyltransferase PARP15-like [Gigantopelta aegis]
MQSSITTYGFNRSFCDATLDELGQGVYFTQTSELAVSKYCKEDVQKQKYLFLSKVITGEFIKGTAKSRVPPCIDSAKPEVLYDSVVDDSSNPTTFVIFNDTQAYPEYLIVVQS